jgi:hypothetical protein
MKDMYICVRPPTHTDYDGFVSILDNIKQMEGKLVFLTARRVGCENWTKKQLKQNIQRFYRFAENNPKWKFYVAQDAKLGYNGYDVDEMVEMWAIEYPPDNVYFYKPFYDLLKKCFPLNMFSE